jgi:outer membrane protein assembly factor BamB
VTIGGMRQILLFTSLVAGVDPATGKVLWSYPYADGKNVGAPVVLGDRVIAGNLSWGLSCRRISRKGDAWSVEKVWSAPELRICSFSPVLEEGHLYLYDDQANVTCVSAESGAVTWSLPTRPHKMEEHANALLLAPHQLLLNFEDGLVVLYEVSSKGGRERARFKAVDGALAMSPVTFDGGRLFVRDQQVLSCFRLTGN